MVSLNDIQEAHARISPYTHYTPLLTNQAVDALATQSLVGDDSSSSSSASTTRRIRLAFKAEHLQRVGAFKYRGATNSVLVHLASAKSAHNGPEPFCPSKLVVVTHSSGNHAAALACAAKSAGCIAAVVMPENAPRPKKDAVAGYGASITFCKPTNEARESTAREVMEKYEKQGYTVKFVHPYDEPLVIAGQGTMALEMLDQAPWLEYKPACSHAAESSNVSARKLFGSKNVLAQGPKAEAAWKTRDASQPVFDIVIAPVGGGGMLSGVSTAIKAADDRIIVIGAEPDLVNDAFHSVQTGKVELPPQPPKTICDGLLTSLSPRTLQHIQKNVDTIVTVREENVLRALHLHWTRQKQFVEPSAAVGMATILQGFNEASTPAVAAAAAQRRANNQSADLENPRSLWGLKDWIDYIVKHRIEAGENQPEIRIGVILSGGNVEVAKVAAKLEEYGF
ncbi:related to SRY1 - 3-hydroxyaspartate dehydratase [Melanopsichium pennsylvanicum]|uniref:Serine racemase n=2 Tax=Melanopsichium pennsylvanicum TaxID=63383 RepID=A0AAJ5C4H0_9BASI|nr:related to SRY1-3-hydroxyaspartate dehydratase [Melanopsichium pennsylvanicum 4]SNX83686.1 related to SRY1 - 3-hydroxyaspartate dehydratase [Melanopsichium pennsylvanicum]